LEVLEIIHSHIAERIEQINIRVYDYEALVPTEGDERIITYCKQKVFRMKWSWPISVYCN